MQSEQNFFSLPSISMMKTNNMMPSTSTSSTSTIEQAAVIGYPNDMNGYQEYQTNLKKRQLTSSSDEEVKRPKITKESESSNDTVTTTAEEKPKKPRKNETICTVCEKGDELLMCDGPCLRSFHVDCLGLGSTPAPNQRWECDDCLNQQNICFACKKRGIVGMDLMKCKVHQCGKFYHHKCVGDFKLAKVVNSKSPRFNCPLHYCETCGVSGDGKQSVHCFRCPTAYHVICMPPGVKMLTKSKETRKTGLILCPKHYGEPAPLNANHLAYSNSNVNNNRMSMQHSCNGHHQHHHQQQPQVYNSKMHFPPLDLEGSSMLFTQTSFTAPSTPNTLFSPMSPSSPSESPKHNNNASEYLPSAPSSPMMISNDAPTPYDTPKYAPTKQQLLYQMQQQQRINLEKVRSELERPRSSFSSKSNYVPSVSTAPSPALSRSNSSENLMIDELTSYATSLISIRDKSLKSSQQLPSPFQPLRESGRDLSMLVSKDDDNHFDQNKLMSQFFQFAQTKKLGISTSGSASILSAPTTPNSSAFTLHQVPSGRGFAL
ncbi:hypothetical protein SAMD00019534_078370 [Acytostelium subglobosum LB1]|uniref:hypothetical protein n=1 Tax=Acytostelium subglobosum LB1 TaxID=1410327 RepID=UPI000644EF62|nr:hypothetical protein SAMD00019534_078370 [Acytostelium subglobosum LB1]GAM24662.1 hypothetical protein SAMD00019534_078370 [Acytostelium subglobosum LB1]|eukprot:XP_012752331.1 hypothetical protein SAMD00019534_078370 [Acytostelium subglobosum LB1]